MGRRGRYGARAAFVLPPQRTAVGVRGGRFGIAEQVVGEAQQCADSFC